MAKLPTGQEPDEPQGTARLVQALRDAQKESIFVPPTIDDAILEKIRPHLAQIRARHRRTTATRWLALAASIAILAGAGITFWHHPQRGTAVASVREDLNGDGHVDILDSFQLARQINAGSALPDADLNGDGRTDNADVDLIAQRAVRLEKGGGG